MKKLGASGDINKKMGNSSPYFGALPCFGCEQLRERITNHFSIKKVRKVYFGILHPVSTDDLNKK